MRIFVPLVCKPRARELHAALSLFWQSRMTLVCHPVYSRPSIISVHCDNIRRKASKLHCTNLKFHAYLSREPLNLFDLFSIISTFPTLGSAAAKPRFTMRLFTVFPLGLCLLRSRNRPKCHNASPQYETLLMWWRFRELLRHSHRHHQNCGFFPVQQDRQLKLHEPQRYHYEQSATFGRVHDSH